MGNSQCKPKEGGESLKDFLTRKFHKLGKKRKIDELVTMAIQTEAGQEAGVTDGRDDHSTYVELLDLEDVSASEDEGNLEVYGQSSLLREPPEQLQNCDNINNKTGHDYRFMPSSREEKFEENDLIRNLQKQLKEVQNELANFQMGVADICDKVVTETDQDGRCRIRSVQYRKSGQAEEIAGVDNLETNVVDDTSGQRSQRNCHPRSQGDVRGRKSSHAMHQIGATMDDTKENAHTRKPAVKAFEKGDNEGKGQPNEGRRTRMQGMIGEGLRTRSDPKPARNKVTVTKMHLAQNGKTDRFAEDSSKIEEKIAALQKRDPNRPGPDRGIVWPKTMANLSKADKAYYVDQFLRSELFRQRCLRKYQGSKTWMNGLTPFQLWILEHEGTAELEAVRHPFPKRQNNAQAKVICWRGNTPPPQPKSP